jgi:hypothetical protein
LPEGGAVVDSLVIASVVAEGDLRLPGSGRDEEDDRFVAVGDPRQSVARVVRAAAERCLGDLPDRLLGGRAVQAHGGHEASVRSGGHPAELELAAFTVMRTPWRVTAVWSPSWCTPADRVVWSKLTREPVFSINVAGSGWVSSGQPAMVCRPGRPTIGSAICASVAMHH